LIVTKSSNTLSLYFGSTSVSFLSSAPTVTLNTWKLIGFAASLTTDQKSTAGTVFSETSSAAFRVLNRASPMDLSTASVIRIGDASNSFSGQISVVRIMTPGGGIVRTTDLCSSDSTMELGTGSFSLVCSGTNRLNSADGECVASCADGTYEVTDAAVAFCSK